MPQTFSATWMTFDHEPEDSELTCLLGNPLRRSAEGFSPFGPGSCGLLGVKAIEDDVMFAAVPRTFSMRWGTAIAVLAAMGISCAILFDKKQDYSLERIWPLPFVWVGLLPGALAILWFGNLVSSSAGDFFLVDKSRRTLESCRAKRTFEGDDIIAFTDLSRYCWISNQWLKAHQIGVLVYAADDTIEWHPLLSDSKRPWADQLAELFQVPVRRITLDKSQSKALRDWA